MWSESLDVWLRMVWLVSIIATLSVRPIRPAALVAWLQWCAKLVAIAGG